ncbi:hypothetical protein ACTMP8_24735, partial [Escherichia coli]
MHDVSPYSYDVRIHHNPTPAPQPRYRLGCPENLEKNRVTAPPAARGGASSRHPSGNVPYLERGSREYWHASLALLFAGYATFSLLYYVQPLLPEFSRDFG